MKCQNPECEKEFPAVRSTAKYCSEKCKKVVQRRDKPKGKPGRPPKNPDNDLARAALKKRVPVAKPAPAVVNPPPASVFSLLKSKLAKKDTRGPVPVKTKSQLPARKGGES